MRRLLSPSAQLCAILVFVAAAAPALGQENLVVNGGFEDIVDGRPAHWSIAGDPTVIQTLSVDKGVTSGHSARHECTSFERQTRDGYAILSQTGQMGLKRDRWYRFSCWARQENMATAMVAVDIYADVNAPIPQETTGLYYNLELTSQWQRFERYFKMSYRNDYADPDLSKILFYFDYTGTLFLDDVEIVEVPTPVAEYTDAIAEIGATNLLANGGFECGPDHWTSRGMVGLYGDIQSDTAFDGSYSLRIDLGPGKSPVSSSDHQPVVYNVQSAPMAANIERVSVETGKPYTLSAYMRADKPDVPAKLGLRFGAPLERGRGKTEDVTLSTEWKRYSVTAIADNRYASVAIGPDMSDNPDATVSVWIDAMQLEQGAEAGAFSPREPVEVGLSTVKYGNVFDVDETAALTINAANRTFLPARVTFDVEIEDFFGNKASAFSKDLRIPANNEIEVNVPLGLTDTGFYSVSVSWNASGRKHDRSMRMAIIEPYMSSDSVFGVNHAPSTNQGCESLRRSGVVWAREWVMDWEQREPEPGKFDFEAADLHIDRVLGTGMQMVQQLPPYPSVPWNTTAPEGVLDKMTNYGKNTIGVSTYPPKDVDAFARYVKTVVNHYKGRFKTWEYLNEPLYTIYSLPNLNQMDHTQPNIESFDHTVDDLVPLLKVFYESVKEADPDAVALGGLCARPDLLQREFFEAGGLQYVDRLNMHVYPCARPPEVYISQMAKLLELMDANSPERKPIWITEYAYYAREAKPYEPYVGSGGWNYTHSVRTEKKSADYLVRFAAIMLANEVEKICYHAGGNAGGSWCTLRTGAPMKAYAAQAALSSVLGPKPDYVGLLAKPSKVDGKDTGGVHGYAFQCGERAVLIAWAPEVEMDDFAWTLNTPREAHVANIVGAALQARKVKLGESPVYVTSTKMTAKKLAKACRLGVLE